MGIGLSGEFALPLGIAQDVLISLEFSRDRQKCPIEAPWQSLKIGSCGLRELCCHGIMCSLLTAFFSFFLMGYEILHGVLSHKKNKILGENKFGGPPLPPRGQFFSFFLENTKSA